jgi:hypothetical protein
MTNNIQSQIKCPHCQSQISLDQALQGQLQEHMQQAIKQQESEYQKSIQNLNQKLAEQTKQLQQEHQKQLEAQEQKLKEDLWKKAQLKAKEKQEIQLKSLQEEAKEQEELIKKLTDEQSELLKQQRKLQQKEKQMEIELQKKLNQETKKIQEQVAKDLQEEQSLKLKEKDQQMSQLRKTIEELKRKSEQGSQQTQGDALENDIKEILQKEFFQDNIEDVPTGIRGADLVQTIKNSLGQPSGTILWEVKNTKAWNSDWIKKLKDDQAKSQADLAIIISRTLPEDIENFAFQDGVWITHTRYALEVAKLTRKYILDLNLAKDSQQNKGSKMEMLYDYLSSKQFKNRIENIVSAFETMREDLEKERRAMQRIWAKRSKEIDRVILNTSGMHGDFQGIIGNSLEHINLLQLEEPELEDIA